MTLAEAEQLVVRNHDGLHELMDELEQLATRSAAGDTVAERDLRSLSLEVATELQRHLTFEEQHWYPHLAARLTRPQLARNDVQHRKQRRCIELLRRHAKSAPLRALVECVGDLIRHFRRHTVREHALLST